MKAFVCKERQLFGSLWVEFGSGRSATVASAFYASLMSDGPRSRNVNSSGYPALPERMSRQVEGLFYIQPLQVSKHIQLIIML